MKTYTVRAKRWARGWELHIDGIGVTQARNLGEAEGMVRDYIALDLGVPADSFDVVIATEIGDGLDAEVFGARAAVEEAEATRRAAATRYRTAAQHLRAAGLTGKDIAAVLAVSPQRVSTLLKEAS